MENLSNEDKRLKILYEIKDLLTGAAFPFMLMIVLSASFIGMTTTLLDDIPLSIVLLCVGEVMLAATYIVFGRQNGIASVRRLVQNAKKRELGKADKQAELKSGEYSAYKGFLIGFLSCVPYIIFQIIECAAHNSFCSFILIYAFGWATCPFGYAEISPWINLVSVLFPVAIHGAAYIWGAYSEWGKQQRVAEKQDIAGKSNRK